MHVTEDELTNALIQQHREMQEQEKEHYSDAPASQAYPEAHYNQYGNRGAVDLYVTAGKREAHLYEFKSDSAVREVTGANEILRQFNKMRKYFFDGSEHNPPTYSVIFELCFTPSERNFRHIAENAEMYRSAVLEDPYDGPTDEVLSNVTMRHPDYDQPILIQSPGYDFREIGENMTFPEHIKEFQPDVYEEYEETLWNIVQD